MNIEDMDFSTRAYNILKNEGIKTHEELLSLSEFDLLRMKDCGKKTLSEIKDKLRASGYVRGYGTHKSSEIDLIRCRVRALRISFNEQLDNIEKVLNQK